jgi:hypothetical protein
LEHDADVKNETSLSKSGSYFDKVESKISLGSKEIFFECASEHSTKKLDCSQKSGSLCCIEGKKTYCTSPASYMLCYKNACVSPELQASEGCIVHSASFLGTHISQTVQRLRGQISRSQKKFLFSEVAISNKTACCSKTFEFEEDFCIIAVNICAICCIPQVWARNSMVVTSALCSTNHSLCKVFFAKAKLWSQDRKSH